MKFPDSALACPCLARPCPALWQVVAVDDMGGGIKRDADLAAAAQPAGEYDSPRFMHNPIGASH